MNGQDNQRRTYEFLSEKFNSQDIFSKEEFKEATGFTESSFNTYWPKQFKTLLINEGGYYRVSEAFRRVESWAKFQKHVTQTRKIATDYSTFTFDNVVLFEFFMPLTNEGHLRSSLDALFYKDSVQSRLSTVPIDVLREKFSSNGTESDDEVIETICELVSNTFGGYSIAHVNGRYRADVLKYRKEVLESEEYYTEPYLVDETTAVVKFIFPVGKAVEQQYLPSTYSFEDIQATVQNSAAVEHANKVRWLFYTLFVQSIVQVINGEDEIWMLESGMVSKLHIWRMET